MDSFFEVAMMALMLLGILVLGLLGAAFIIIFTLIATSWMWIPALALLLWVAG